jgi:hypothetical protein
MKLYRVYRNLNIDYDNSTYDSFVVATTCKHKARFTHPGRYINEWNGTVESYSSWVNATTVIVEHIGEAKEGTEEGIIVSSYNAG